MKKIIVFLLILIMMLAMVACTKEQPIATNPSTNDPGNTTSSVDDEPEHTHRYAQTVKEPDCVNSGYTNNECECGDAYQSDEVEAIGHTWSDATCIAPKTCSVCAVTEGDVGAHNYQNGTCTVCGGKDSNFKALTSGSWIRTKASNDQLLEQTLCFRSSNGMGPAWSVRYFENIGEEPDPDFMDYLIAEGKLIKYNGTYYQHFGMGDMGEISFTENGNTITVTLLYWDSSIVLERISGNQLKVTAVKGDATVALGSLTAGDIFVWSK